MCKSKAKQYLRKNFEKNLLEVSECPERWSVVSSLSKGEGVAFLAHVFLDTPDTSGSPVSEGMCDEDHGA